MDKKAVKKWDDSTLKPDDLVLCGAGCGRPTKYTPSYLPDECLCNECSDLIGEMMKDETL